MIWKFIPIGKTTIWGGDRLREMVDVSNIQPTPEGKVGEVWILSDIPGSRTPVAEGPDKGLVVRDLIDKYKETLIGRQIYDKFGDCFPLLIKYIDTGQDLSIQVHPDDAMAQKYGYPFGKSEMWIVLDAEEGARLADGFSREVDPSELRTLAESGEIVEAMRFQQIRPGDVFLIPAGRVHAIGKGTMVLEIQESSDLTYRLYDYNRTDSNGNKRPLHLDKAQEALNFADTDGLPVDYDREASLATVVDTANFTTRLINTSTPVRRDYSRLDSFVAIIANEGKASVGTEDAQTQLTKGECVLISADTDGVEIRPEGTFRGAETYISLPES